MQRIKESVWLGPLISGLLAFIAVGQINFLISWIFYIPLFLSISTASNKQVFYKGFFFGLSLASVGFFWMIPGAERFTGHSIFYGIIVFVISAVFFAAYNGLILYCFALIRRHDQSNVSIILNTLLVASCITIGESLMMYVSQGFPWFDLHSGSGLADNIYSIQPAALFGVHILSFAVVAINFLAATFIQQKVFTRLYIPTIVLIGYLLFGYLMMQLFNRQTLKGKPFNVAILAENIMPDIKWDDNTGNLLVQRLLDLNRTAVNSKPAIMLWSESAIPWTYKNDDDLVNEIVKITRPANSTHILGINTAVTGNIIFNSAYCLLPNGEVTGRYDKQFLLALIEKPLNGFIMPFFSSKGFVAENSFSHAAPLQTNVGKAGIFICNEAAIPSAAANMVTQGAQFLFNMSNDGWFNETYIVRLHYLYARLRAVEARKDLVVNSNNGYSGLIKADGSIEEMRRSEESFVQMVTVEPNDQITIAARFPHLFVYFCVINVLMIVTISTISKRNANKTLK